MQSVFVNPERCIGCRRCEFACSVEHSQSQVATAAIRENPVPRAGIHVSPGLGFNTLFPNRCGHCEPAYVAATGVKPNAWAQGEVIAQDILGYATHYAGTCGALMLRGSDVGRFGEEPLDPRFNLNRCVSP